MCFDIVIVLQLVIVIVIVALSLSTKFTLHLRTVLGQRLCWCGLVVNSMSTYLHYSCVAIPVLLSQLISSRRTTHTPSYYNLAWLWQADSCCSPLQRFVVEFVYLTALSINIFMMSCKPHLNTVPEVDYHCKVYHAGCTVQFYSVHFWHGPVAFTLQIITFLDHTR